MEENSANKPESTPQNTHQQLQHDDNNVVDFEYGKFKFRGPLRIISTLIIGLLAGGLIFYLAVFQLKKPQIIHRVLVEELLSLTLTAAPSATPLPPQIVEVTREVTRIVPTVYVTREIVLEPTVLVTRETVVVTEIVFVPTVVIVTPTSTPVPEPNEILERDLKVAFQCGALVLRQLSGINFQGYSKEKIQNRILLQWQNTNCAKIWQDFAQDSMIIELVQMLKQFTDITRVEWKADLPVGFNPRQEGTTYFLSGFRTSLQISGQYQCPSTMQTVSIVGDVDPLTFESDEMTVEVQKQFDRIVIKKWQLHAGALELLDQNCQ